MAFKIGNKLFVGDMSIVKQHATTTTPVASMDADSGTYHNIYKSGDVYVAINERTKQKIVGRLSKA